MGEALEPFRGQVVIATKFGFKLKPDGGRGDGSLSGRAEEFRTREGATRGRAFFGGALAGMSITGAYATPPKVKEGELPHHDLRQDRRRRTSGRSVASA